MFFSACRVPEPQTLDFSVWFEEKGPQGFEAKGAHRDKTSVEVVHPRGRVQRHIGSYTDPQKRDGRLLFVLEDQFCNRPEADRDFISGVWHLTNDQTGGLDEVLVLEQGR